jgi:hypothetical protein
VTRRQAGVDRRAEAERALEQVAAELSANRLLAVQCANGHHVAGVYRTDVGPVVQAATGRHAHGRRDRVDTPHGGSQSSGPWTDLLEPAAFADDTLPAWCDCGPWTLSRADLAAWIDRGERRVVLESHA